MSCGGGGGGGVVITLPKAALFTLTRQFFSKTHVQFFEVDFENRYSPALTSNPSHSNLSSQGLGQASYFQKMCS